MKQGNKSSWNYKRNFTCVQMQISQLQQLTKTLGSSGICVLLSSVDSSLFDVLSESSFFLASSLNGLESIDGSFLEWFSGASGEISVGSEDVDRSNVRDADFIREKLKIKTNKEGNISIFVELIKIWITVFPI